MAHRGTRNPRLTRLMKKRSRVAAHRTSTAPGPKNCGSHHDTGRGTEEEEVPVLEKRQEDKSDDLTKVLATVVNVIDDGSSHSFSHSTELRISSVPPLLEASLTAFPAFPSLTADTPSLTSSQSSTPSATSSYSSATTSRPLINSSIPTSSATSLVPSASPSSIPASSLSTSSASRVTRSSTKTSPSVTSLSASSASSASSLSSSLSSLSSLPSSSSSLSSSISSSTTSSSTTTTSDYFWYTGGYGGYGGGGSSGTGSGQSPTSTGSGSLPGPSGPTVPPTTSKIVGGVVGSVAGAVMLVVLALFLLHRRRTMAKSPEGLSSSEGAGARAAVGAGDGSRSGEMTSRWSRDSIFTAAYLAPAFMKRWRQSTQTNKTDSTLVSGGSERGFQKVSGRKIPSVLMHGGDGFGGGYETGSPTVSEPSMSAVPGSSVNPRSSSQPPPSSPFGMPLDTSYTREAEEDDDPTVYVRSSPARTPVASSASVGSVSAPINIPRVPSRTLSPTFPQQPDTLGRSHPSFDGSRGSRFTESL